MENNVTLGLSEELNSVIQYEAQSLGMTQNEFVLMLVVLGLGEYEEKMDNE